MTENFEDQLRSFIVENFLFGQGGDDLARDDSFLDKGIIDSTGVLELIGFLESSYGISVADHELVPENLDSLGGLEAFLRQKLDSRSNGGQLAG